MGAATTADCARKRHATVLGMREVLDDVRRMLGSGDRVALATVVDTRRSAPRPLGSRLALSSSGEMVGSVSGGCVESDVALRAEEVLAGGPPLLLRYGISDDDAFDVGLPCGGEIEVFVQNVDAEELDRVEAALASGERLSVTTTVAGEGAGHKVLRRRRGALRRRPRRREHLRRALRPGSGDDGVRRRRHRPGPVPDGEAGRLPHRGLRRPGQVRHPRAAARRRRGCGGLAGDGVRPACARRGDLRGRADPRRPLRRARAGAGAALDGALHRCAREPAGAGLAPAATAERGLHRGRDRPHPGPLGLDIGAVTPAETAVSILAEVLAVRANREGGALSRKAGRIHPESVAS